MKQYILIALIALHLISSSVYAKNMLVKQNHIYTSINLCSIHQHTHFHGSSSHVHKHTHTKSHVHVSDFYAYNQNITLLTDFGIKEIYLETHAWIPNPTLKSLFRPPRA